MGLCWEIHGVYGAGGLRLLHLHPPHPVQVLPGSLVREGSSCSSLIHHDLCYKHHMITSLSLSGGRDGCVYSEL